MNQLPIIQTIIPPDVIDLGLGNPDITLLPLEALAEASQAFFSAGDRRPLQYGAERGNAYFRHALSDFLKHPFGAPVNPDYLFVTAGASSGLDLICTLFTQPGDTIFVEEPTYFLALRIFADHGLKVISIPMDQDGLNIDALQEKLKQSQPKFLYTIPTFQNPSGLTLTKTRRERLIELAKKHDFLIVADEVYHCLPYTQNPPAPFASYTHDSKQVISVNSFSKILAPGLRLGWIQAHPTLIQKLAGSGLLDSGGGMNPFTSAIVQKLIESGDLERNITRLKEAYSSRLDQLNLALHKHLPQAEFTRPDGGFFIWVRLPGIDAAELRSSAHAHKVDFRPGPLFSGQRQLKEYIRLSFCYYDREALEEGVNRITDCFQQGN